MTANETAIGLWFADLATAKLPAETQIEFILRCGKEQAAERHRVAIYD